MLRVASFAGLGRFGLPLVAVGTGAALWSTSWAMAASAPSKAVTVALPQHPPVRAGGEQVGVSIPSVVFGQADGLGRTLSVGYHTARVQVWLAAGSPAAVATVSSFGVRVDRCTAAALHPAGVTTLHCVLDVPRNLRSVVLTVATSVAGQHFAASYSHGVR